MGYRHELKFVIGKADADLLKKQLALVCTKDPHSVCDEYSYDIRSLYFDDIFHSGYYDKINGVEYRKKYRIRIYNGSCDVIKFECKHKDGDMTLKEECDIDLDTAKILSSGIYSGINVAHPLIDKFLMDARLFGLRPSVIVDYRRLAFTYPVSNVRITFDENICSSKDFKTMFDKQIKALPIEDNDQIELEIKCDEFMPDHIKAVLNSVDKCRVAISKFALASDVR